MSQTTRHRLHEEKPQERSEESTPPGGEQTPFTTLVATFALTAVNQSLMFVYLGFMPFLYQQYNVDTVTYGYIQSSFAFLTLCLSPFVGRLADVFGARQVLILALVCMALSHVTMGLATGLPMLLISRAVSVLMDAGPASQMIITDVTPAKDRGYYLSKGMIPISIGMILGPTVGGFLGSQLGSQNALMLTWIPAVIAVMATVTLIPTTTKQTSASTSGTKEGNKEDQTTWSKTLSLMLEPEASSLLLQRFMITKKGGVQWSHLNEVVGKGDIPYLIVTRVLATLPGMIFMMNFQLAGVTYFKMTPQQNGMIVSYLGLMNMINNWFVIPYVNKKIHEDSLMKIAPVISLGTYFCLSQTVAVWQLVGVLFPLNLSYAIMENQVMTRLTKSVDPSDTSTMVGIGTMLFHLARTISPTLGGILMHQMGWSAIGHSGTLVSLVMVTLAFLKHR